MIWLVALVSLAIGIAIGYRLPKALAWWRGFRHRQTFRPTVLQPYHPAGSGQAKDGQSVP